MERHHLHDADRFPSGSPWQACEMQLDVGPYRFSGKDARRTLLHATEFLDDFPPAAHTFQAERRARIAAAMTGVDARSDETSNLSGALGVVWAELLTARDDLVAAGALPPTSTGTVERLSVSDGGLPKLSVDRVDVDFGGVAGDRQASRNHHGSPFQALCLWNVESIDHLAAEGHPISYGATGENVTIAGIDWPSVRPGVRLRLGSILCEISSHAEPCNQNARWFSDGDFTRIHDRNGPWSRMYATVIEPGSIALGDAAVLEPASGAAPAG